jgi:hypothetical protein
MWHGSIWERTCFSSRNFIHKKLNCINIFYNIHISSLIIFFLFSLLVSALQPSSVTSIWISWSPTGLPFCHPWCEWNSWWGRSARHDMDTSDLFSEWSEVYSNGIIEKRHHSHGVPRRHSHLCTKVRCKRKINLVWVWRWCFSGI